MRDRHLVFAAGFLRGLAAGLVSVLAAIFLAKRGFPAGEIGIVLTAGLAGVAVGTAYGTFLADRVGRRRSLVGLSLLGAAGGAVLAWSPDLWTLTAAAFFGMLNTQGTDRGAAQALEVAILPVTIAPRARTQVFAWYNALQDVGGAAGAALAAAPQLLREGFGVAEPSAYAAAILAYAGLLVLAALIYARLSPAAEPGTPSADRAGPVTARREIHRFAALSALDAFGGGFIGSALIAYFFYLRFGVTSGELAGLFLAGRIMTVLSHFGAAWLAGRIGLVNTMVFTHIPSSLLLLTIPLTGSFGLAAFLFILREGLVEMDVPTRQSYLMAIVPPGERAYASGLSQLARAGGRVLAPGIAGGAMQAGGLWFPLAAGATLKIVYDVLLWRAFRNVKPPEE
jgi:MFS family permease